MNRYKMTLEEDQHKISYICIYKERPSSKLHLL